MAEILVIDGDTVLVDTDDIDFDTAAPPPDNPIQAAQLATVAAALPDPASTTVAQLSAVEAAIIPPVPLRLYAFAIVQVITGNRRSLTLRNPISLPCWQPCTAYGFQGRIIIRGR